MGIVKGLKGIQKREAEKAERREAAENRIQWFKLEKSGDATTVRFLQEMDDESPHYSAKNDLGFVAVEHSKPGQFRVKALCTIDDDYEGACVPCEMNKKSYETVPDYKGEWKQKERFYINVLVQDSPDSEPYVRVLSQGTSDKSIVPALIDVAVDSGSITNRWFKIKRNGQDFNNTSYLLTPRDTDDSVDVEAYDLYDLDKAVRHVPYAEQMKHFGLLAVQEDEGASRIPVSAGTSIDNEEW